MGHSAFFGASFCKCFYCLLLFPRHRHCHSQHLSRRRSGGKERRSNLVSYYVAFVAWFRLEVVYWDWRWRKRCLVIAMLFLLARLGSPVSSLGVLHFIVEIHCGPSLDLSTLSFNFEMGRDNMRRAEI